MMLFSFDSDYISPQLHILAQESLCLVQAQTAGLEPKCDASLKGQCGDIAARVASRRSPVKLTPSLVSSYAYIRGCQDIRCRWRSPARQRRAIANTFITFSSTLFTPSNTASHSSRSGVTQHRHLFWSML